MLYDTTDNLKLIYAEIIKGYSMFSHKNNSFFIKHLNHLDAADIDMYKQTCLDKAVKRGLLLYQTKLSSLIQEGKWTQSKETEIKEIQDFIINLKHSKSKVLLEREKKTIDKEIERYNDRLFLLVKDKQELVGRTAEDYASRKVNEYYLFTSLYREPQFIKKFYSWEEFDELDQFELSEILNAYNKKVAPFNDVIMKKIALMPSFMNLFLLCEDNIYTFYGKSIVNLSFYQIELFQCAKTFKNILQNTKTPPPPEIMNDPNQLLEWFDNSNKAAEIIQNNPIPESDKTQEVVGGTSIVGAKTQDYKKFGMDDKDNQALMKKLQEKGELTWQDLI